MALLVGGLAGLVTAAHAEADGLHVQTRRQPLADEHALARLRREISECDKGIADAKRDGDPVVAETIRKERDALQEQLRRLTRPDGQSKAFGSHADKLRSAIYSALARAYAALRKGNMPTTADHLEGAICAQGGCYIYNPTPRPEWNLK